MADQRKKASPLTPSLCLLPMQRLQQKNADFMVQDSAPKNDYVSAKRSKDTSNINIAHVKSLEARGNLWLLGFSV